MNQVSERIFGGVFKEKMLPVTRKVDHDATMEGRLDLTVDNQDYDSSGPAVALSCPDLLMQNQVLTGNPQDNLQLSDFLQFQQSPPVQQSTLTSLLNLRLTDYHHLLHLNRNNQLSQLQTSLSSLVQHNQININNFSQNTLTSCNTYLHSGEFSDTDYMAVPIENKRYTDEDVFNKLPHPVRIKVRRQKKTQKGVGKKPREEIVEEFQILAGMFRIKEGKEEQQGVKEYRKVLDMLTLQEDAEYNDLWEQILTDIDVTKQKDKKKLKPETFTDDQFGEAIERIIKDAEEEQEEMELPKEEDKEEDVPEQTVQETKKPAIVKQQQPQVEQDFRTIQISNKKLSNFNKHLYAQQDQSDLTHFYDILPKQKFAMTYPFELDDFQKRSILHLQKKQSVFVAAHTSAGKTVIAQYGIALAIKHKRKVIYTSPIKALSNQKYRDFVEKFGSVGIVTGDISLNQEASCVIMTTEILRNSLYKGADMIRDIEWVIFDEVHYINNQERGVVWEETFIMLPEHIGIIMLSATVPNYMDFANWVGRTKHRKIFVMKTFHRPVPLEHSMFILDRFHIIKEANGKFLKQEYEDLRKKINVLNMDHEAKKEFLKQEKKKKIEERGFYNDSRRQQNLRMQTQQAVNKFIKNVSQGDVDRYKDREESRTFSLLIDECKKKTLLPCVIFCFSKKKIMNLVQALYTTKLNTNQQSHQVIQFFHQALSNLKPQDQHLSQFTNLLNYACAGYSIHHGDLLPLAKQIVQLLFSKGLIKVLLATQTFAMGINMPTKTVIFHSLRKFEGATMSERQLNSSEYVQMSGRAGRRGLDQKGTVIVMVKDPQQLPETQDMVRMMDNPGEYLISKFRVTYQIILNLFTSKELNVESMMRDSFIEDEKFSSLPENIATIRSYKKEYDRLSRFECPYNQLQTRQLIDEYMNQSDGLRVLNDVIFSETDSQKLQLPKFGLILGHNNEIQLCIVLRIIPQQQSNDNRFIHVLTVSEMDTNFYFNKEESEAQAKPKKKRIKLQYQNSKSDKVQNGAVPQTNNQYHYYTHFIKPSELLQIYSNKLPCAKYSDVSRQVLMQLSPLLLKPPKQLTPYGQSQHRDLRLQRSKAFTTFPCHNCQFKQPHTQQNQRRLEYKHRLIELQKKVNRSELLMMSNFEGMLKVLQKFKFVSDTSILLKGRIARETDVYVAEVLVEAVLDPLNECELAALLSGFVNQFRYTEKKRKDDERKLSPFHPKDDYTDTLWIALRRTADIISKLTQAEIDENAFPADSADELLNNVLNFHLVRPIYEWSMGLDFIEICQFTDAPEGTIVRTIMRLDILLRNLKSGCLIMGNTTLASKIDKASQSIKRDIVFAQSLYIN